jgi:hypothetical protein
MLVECGLADADVGQNLIDADVPEAIAVKARHSRLDEPLASVRWHANPALQMGDKLGFDCNFALSLPQVNLTTRRFYA